MKSVIAAVLFLALTSCSKTPETARDLYKAGTKTIRIADKSRIYRPGADSTNYLYYRPIDIDIWYPADSTNGDTTLLFRDILGLLDKRANYYTASNAGDGLSRQIAQLFCTGFQCSDTTKLLNLKTGSLRNAPAVDAKFPLVIYFSAFNGMSYENFTLFERLAKRGFVVASISSIGRFPGDMTMKNEDLMEQVYDAVATVNALKQVSTIDFSKIGLVGYSWGGLAALVAAGKLPNVACMVSLDGSEYHHYGQSKEEDTDFNGIVNSPFFQHLYLSMPYLRLESSPLGEKNKKETVYNFRSKLSTNAQRFRVDSASHEDFGCLSLVVKKSGSCQNDGHFDTISALTISFLEDNLLGTASFLQLLDKNMNKTIYKR